MKKLWHSLTILLFAACLSGCIGQGQAGVPPVLFGGEMHNSNASTPASIDASMDLAAALKFNAVLAPVYWELTEPRPGDFDFSLVDHLLKAAEERDLYLGLLWFGSWKNGESSYPPLWVRSDTGTYFHAEDPDGNPTTTISPFCLAAQEADARAFKALMAHLRKADRHHRVRAVQIENECGVFLERDLCPAAQKAWTEGGWDTDTLALAPQRFMAEACARYIDAIAAAGKSVNGDIPLFTNAWLADENARYGSYPNGGPRLAVLDVWKKTATHLDWLSPDIYSRGFASLCAAYADGQPLFIPETRCEAGRYYYAIGEARATGVFAFGYEEYHDDPHYVQECRVFSELVPMLGRDCPTHGFFREEGVDAPDGSVSLPFGSYTFDVHYIAGEKNAHGLFIRTGENEFIAAGVGAWVSFRTGGDRKCCLASCEELYGGEVVQVLNGDETAHDNLLFLRGRLYQQDAVAPDGETIPAALYGLSSQRRFRKDAQARFKVSGIYRIKLLP